MTIHHGDCVEVMAGMPEASIDAIVTDPPYGLEFMGKEWDRLDGAGFHAPKDEGRTFTNASGHMFDNLKALPRYGSAQRSQRWHEQWAAAALRVAKPGAYLLAFGGTRTVHRMTVALEDAGWVIRDMLVWAYAQGFPKSRALLKPAWEPIVMARKPGPLRDLDIDGCRIGTGGDKGVWPITARDTKAGLYNPAPAETDNTTGRWPANVVLTDPIFDGGWEGVVGGGEAKAGIAVNRNRPDEPEVTFEPTSYALAQGRGPDAGYGDTDTYSRFFLIPKASRSDREPVLPGMLDERPAGALNMRTDSHSVRNGMNTAARRNVHPTVKPVELMRHLVRLVTPADGTVLDPFLGSGTTALAAEQEGRAWVGIEREAEYVAIAEARLSGWQRGLGLDRGHVALRVEVECGRSPVVAVWRRDQSTARLCDRHDRRAQRQLGKHPDAGWVREAV